MWSTKVYIYCTEECECEMNLANSVVKYYHWCSCHNYAPVTTFKKQDNVGKDWG